jgi:hypothetical protein
MLRKALLIAALGLFALPAMAQQNPEVRVQRPNETVVPGRTYRLNDLEKRQIEQQKQREFEEAAARAFAPPPQHDVATELREDWWTNPRDRSNGAATVKQMIRSRPGATFTFD